MKILIFGMLLVSFFWSPVLDAKVKIVSTLPVFSALAQAVGGEAVTIDTLVRSDQDPHFLQAKPSYVMALNRADLLLHAGMDLDVGWLPTAVVQSRNPKIQKNAKGDLDLSKGIGPLEVPPSNADRSSGDIHPMGNPHYWLDPRNGHLLAQSILQALIRMDPTGATQYQRNFENFAQELKGKLIVWKTQIQAMKNLKVITFHTTWSYFADYAGISVMATIEPKPGIPPNSRHVEQLVSLIPAERVKLLLMAPYYPRKVPEYLAAKVGILLVVGRPQPQEPTAQAYFQMFSELIRKLEGAKGV